MNKLDLTGQRYGFLTVLEEVPKEYIKSKHRYSYWKCKCDCGKECIVTLSHLRSGHTKSCGCWKKQATINYNKLNKAKKNNYDLSGKYGIGYTDNIDPTDLKQERNYFYFDLEDFDLIKNYYWFFDACGYLIAYKKEQERGFWKLHRLVMGVSDQSILVDHIKHVLYDNRKTELRLCTQNQNMQNRKPNQNTKTIITGVVKTKNNTYNAYITYNKKRMYLGAFKTLEEAIAARKEAEDKYFGEYSYDNSMSMNTENKETIDI